MRLLSLTLALLLSLAPATTGAAEDFHELFEARCTGCHGHAGDFARENLVLSDGVLRGRESGQVIAPFLRRHKGGLDAEQTALFVEVLTKQVEAGGLFQQDCAICHPRARGLVRSSLILRDGRLFGRYSGNDIQTFLLHHGRATPEEAALLYDALHGIALGRR